ncbi:unnamed protein product [Effrenium voratum]|nr:unnamed protein product [Effrenium voratum]
MVVSPPVPPVPLPTLERAEDAEADGREESESSHGPEGAESGAAALPSRRVAASAHRLAVDNDAVVQAIEACPRQEDRPIPDTWSPTEAAGVISAVTETLRQSRKSLSFHSKRLVVLLGPDFAGHVHASQGARVVSELSGSIDAAMQSVEDFKLRLLSMQAALAQREPSSPGAALMDVSSGSQRRRERSPSSALGFETAISFKEIPEESEHPNGEAVAPCASGGSSGSKVVLQRSNGSDDSKAMGCVRASAMREVEGRGSQPPEAL